MQSFRKLVNKLRGRQATGTHSKTPQATTANANANANSNNIKSVPQQAGDQQVIAAQTPPTLTVTLRNASNSSQVYVYVTGLALDSGTRPMFLQSDGRTIYYPSSPSNVRSPLAADVSIALGAPGSTRDITIPRIAGGRVWFSIGKKLVFALNPGPGVVEVMFLIPI